ncbi:polyribonucleotide nucleotidyltransferase [Ructibacterium gallinarum]|uniref:Polyribonucleotide nucleotidyltransferase n=1 Tax=Ructibacterium gallinarum TaxID=2779355 RepID=A0A9D5R8N9_9FIRM|nr:polyribonucleotide nucleotidyltransferase [Ructibacterium gallinarum]MBE5040616.1 polyribonucleotide nucleotidyltransferase [Ructibacterium gallinarum]
MSKIYETEVAGRKLSLEFGKVAGLANGSVLVRYGDTVVITAATASDKPRDGIDFFPLSIDYEEKMYAVGKIPGGFTRREGRPSENAILTARVIDRPMRPLFPKDLRNDVSIVSTVLSVEQDNAPEFCAMIGSSAAVCVSDIPFNGPIAAVYVGLVDGEFVINPTEAQREVSEMNLTVAGSAKKVVMIEAGANEVPEDKMFAAIMFAHEEIKKLCAFIQKIQDEIGKPKFEYEHMVVDEQLFNDIRAYAEDMVKEAMDTDDKTIRDARLAVVYDNVYEYFNEQYPVEEYQLQIDEALYKLQKTVVRNWLMYDKKRVDGRGILELRPLSAEVGLLPRAHGSGLFSRGQTQVLTVATLGPLGEAKIIDGLDNEEYRRYLHHYNFPSYSVGETRPSRGPGRREIGHGALAERALVPVIPSESEFPYAIRLVSEVLSSNGSTSQGSVCGSTLALMDAGVPIKAPVAGISVGLITDPDDEDNFLTMVDIQGVEDFFGDMDFKVAGTKKGITAIQMDLKIDGLTPAIIRTALEQTKNARCYILDEVMLKAIAKPREELSPYAPKIINMTVPVDKIREVIGSGGKVIQGIIAETGAKIDIEDDGSVYIAAVDTEMGEKARRMIEAIVKEPEVGEIYEGKVVRIMDFGAFVELLPGKDGLIHISKLAKGRVEKVTDVVKEGDIVKVEVIEIDDKGRINLRRLEN